MPDARIKDCVCAACAKKMGYEPSKDVAGVWTGECAFCGELKPLTSLAHDWKRTRTGEEAAVAGDKETVAEIVSEMRGSTKQRYCASKHCSVKVFNPILDFADRIKAAHRREVDAILKDRDEMYKSEQETIAKTNAWFGEYQTLKRAVAELRECLEQACGDKLGTYTMKGIEVQRWLKALGRSER